ncbi:MAG: ADP-ribosylglycohydrolase family protein [Myxococcales bacterium]|nr:ADP-ribosylglycohydrolase family protein [Myxococcales bacterium]
MPKLPTPPADHPQRMQRVRRCVDGLSLGDAFGERFFVPPGEAVAAILRRELPSAPWRYTDDTVMAIAIAEVLDRFGAVIPDHLARAFASRFTAEPDRGYGGGAFTLLRSLALGAPWAEAAAALFDGQGSMGNGGAMRAAPVGAYFAGDPEAIVAHAQRSAAVTHAHPEGQAGAVAVALAAGWAALVGAGARPTAGLFEHVLSAMTTSRTRDRIAEAARLAPETRVDEAAAALGSGQQVLAEDTVPFALWAASRHLDDFEEAMWATALGLGDRDTTCAIVGGIVALAAPTAALPARWIAAREPLPSWG